MSNYEYLFGAYPEKLAKEIAKEEWCNKDCIYELARGCECEKCILNWLNEERKEE